MPIPPSTTRASLDALGIEDQAGSTGAPVPADQHLEQPARVSHDTFTRLVDKHYSPLVIRKTTRLGFPIFVAIIADDDLTDFDDQINAFIDRHREGWSDNVQKMRDFAGGLVEHLLRAYKKTEGAAVIIYADKMFVSSLHGDFMCHASCKQELMFLLNMSTGV
jgi:hypothetical protein